MSQGSVTKRNAVVSGLESGAQPDFVQVPLDEALGLIQHQFEMTGIKVCRVRNKRALVGMNPSALLWVFTNVLMCSARLMPSGGQIDISISEIESQKRKWVEVRVRDYAEEPGGKLPRLYHPSVALELNEVLEDLEEQGILSLALCRELVEVDNGGHFMVRNHEVRGHEIIIQLPRAAGA